MRDQDLISTVDPDQVLEALSASGMQLTPHFTLPELWCHCPRHHGPFVAGVDRSRLPYGGIANLRILANFLEEIRHILGDDPIHSASGYRCRAHNAEIPGAAKNSFHIAGEADDLHHSRLSPKEVQRALKAHWGRGQLIHGLGEAKTYTHVDRGNRIARWYYDSNNIPHPYRLAQLLHGEGWEGGEIFE